MLILVPSEPGNLKKPDENYAEETTVLAEGGFGVVLFSLEDFEMGRLRTNQPIPQGESVVYRGWMLSPEDYARLCQALKKHGVELLTTPAQYQHCHCLPNWYGLCEDLTPKTVFAAQSDDLEGIAASTGWRSFFVKDHVKSLTTARGSVARSAQDVPKVVQLIEQFRGRIEGGVCIREFVELASDSEARFFVVRGQAFAATGTPPQIVNDVATRIDSPFFSVDVAQTTAGEVLVIELGDGQVSDRKNWPAQGLATILKNL